MGLWCGFVVWFRWLAKHTNTGMGGLPRSLTTGLFSIFFVRPAKLEKGSIRWSPSRKPRNTLKGIEGILTKLDAGSEVDDQKAHG